MKLNTDDRKKMSKSSFGIPETKGYPLNDEEHVRKAIQMFSHCPTEHRKTLAKKILSKAKRYNIEIKENSPVRKALAEELEFINLFFTLEE